MLLQVSSLIKIIVQNKLDYIFEFYLDFYIVTTKRRVRITLFRKRLDKRYGCSKETYYTYAFA